MEQVAKIGKAKDVENVIDDLNVRDDIEEIVVFVGYRDEDGEKQWRVDYSRLHSKFAMIGLVHWFADIMLDGD